MGELGKILSSQVQVQRGGGCTIQVTIRYSYKAKISFVFHNCVLSFFSAFDKFSQALSKIN